MLQIVSRIDIFFLSREHVSGEEIRYETYSYTALSLARVALIYEIHAEEMQYQAPEDEIRKRPVILIQPISL